MNTVLRHVNPLQILTNPLPKMAFNISNTITCRSLKLSLCARFLAFPCLQQPNCVKITAFWDIALCSLVEADRHFKDAYRAIALMIEAVRAYETYVYFATTRRYIPDDCHLHTRRRKNLKSQPNYMSSSPQRRLFVYCPYEIVICSSALFLVQKKSFVPTQSKSTSTALHSLHRETYPKKQSHNTPMEAQRRGGIAPTHSRPRH
jgi:hypothetical protein